MITKQEAKQIVDWVINEIRRRQFGYLTGGKIDFYKPTVGQIGGGTSTSGGQIKEGAIYDRHVNDDADIRGTKVRYATKVEEGVQILGYTQDELNSTLFGSGASLIGVEDPSGYFTGENVEAVLAELFTAIGAITFIDLVDTPNQYTALWSHKGWIPVIDNAQAGLEFKPVHYIDGGAFTDDYAGVVVINDTPIDGGAFTENHILDGGSF